MSSQRWVDELALPERAAVLAWLWEAQSEGVVVLAEDRVLDANGAACSMLGCAPDALVGKERDDPVWQRVRHPDGGPVAPDELPGGARAVPVYAIHAPGQPERLVRTRIDRRTSGRHELALVTFVDVTAELEARRAVERVTESVEEFLFTAVLEGHRLRLVYQGPGAERLLGGPLPEGVAPERVWFGAVHPDDHEISRRAIRDTAAGHPTTVSYRLVGLDGRTRWVRSRTQRRVEPDGVVRIDGIVSDITAMRLHEEALLRLTQEHEAIGNVATTIAGGADRAAIFAAAAREAALLLDADAGAIATLGAGAPEVVGDWHAGARHEALLERALHEARSMVRAGDGSRAFAPAAQQFAVAAPVRVDGRPWGVILACRTSAAFGARDERALVRLGDLVGTAVGVSTARDLLVRQASTDGLTGLCNHRAFHDALRGEVRRARRYGRPLGVVLVDLDRFKEVNDRHGHQAGDRLLCAVADALRGVVRGSEIVARVGGDEFALLLPETDLEGAQATAERVREAIDGLPDAAEQGVTASAGVADLDQAGSADDLIRLADGALYWSKVHGRNRVSAYDPERVEALSAQERAERLARTQALGAVRVLARLIDLKDPSTHEHSERVARLAVLLARELRWSADRIGLLRDAALVHDAGKVVIADAILNKPDALTEDEFALVRLHPATGAHLAGEALGPEPARWIAEHHERPDGTGYPAGLRGDQISDGGRILAFADGWDVITSVRPYKAATPPQAARAEVVALAGRQFDAEVLAAFERLWAVGAVTATD